MLTLIGIGVIAVHWKEFLAAVIVITVIIILLVRRRNKAIRAAAAAAAAAAASAPLLGNKNTQIYHKHGCHVIRGIPSYQLVAFKTNTEAAACGYKDCQVCKPRG